MVRVAGEGIARTVDAGMDGHRGMVAEADRRVYAVALLNVRIVAWEALCPP